MTDNRLLVLGAAVSLLACGMDDPASTHRAALCAPGCASDVVVKASSSLGRFSPDLTLDGDTRADSRWWGGGEAWIEYDLPTSVEIDRARLRFFHAGSAPASFAIDVSSDGVTFTRVVSGQTGLGRSAVETFVFPAPVSASRVRIDGGGTEAGPDGLIEAAFLDGATVVVGAGISTVLDCLGAADCDDGDGSTTDSCDIGLCSHTPIPCGDADGLCAADCPADDDLDCPADCAPGVVGSPCRCEGVTMSAGLCCVGSCQLPSGFPTGADVTIDRTAVVDTQPGVAIVVDIAIGAPIRFRYTNNSVTAQNAAGYILSAGTELDSIKNNHLDGSVITGNQLTWVGTDPTAITHGLFVGYGVNHTIEYNFLRHDPYGVVTKSSGMAFTSGGIAYNLITDSVQGVTVKGISGVNVFGNTFYDTLPVGAVTGLVKVYANQDGGLPGVPSTNTLIENNIFYTREQVPNIAVFESSRVGFKSDHNVFFCESGEPVFYVESLGTISFAQWRALGYDAHSVIADPHFIDFERLVPARPVRHAADLGPTWREGLAPTTVWGQTPVTATQGAHWQNGAYVL